MAKYQSKRAARKSKLKIAERKLSGLCPECGLNNNHEDNHKVKCKNHVWNRRKIVDLIKPGIFEHYGYNRDDCG